MMVDCENFTYEEYAEEVINKNPAIKYKIFFITAIYIL